MAKWWLLGVQFPENRDTQFIQIYSDTPESATSLAHTLFIRNKMVGPDETVGIFVRDSSDSPFTNPVITSNGLQGPPGSTGSGKPPPDDKGDKKAFDGDEIGIPENETGAQFTRGLQERGVNLNTISGRAQSSDQRQRDYLMSFVFQSLLQGLNPGAGGFQPQNEQDKTAFEKTFGQASPDQFQRFARETDIGGVRRGAANALTDLLSANPVGQLGPGLQYLRGEKGFAQPTEGQAGSLAGLAQTALASRISPLALQLLNLPSGSNLRDRFLAEGGQGSFLDYFRQQYPLMGLGI